MTDPVPAPGPAQRIQRTAGQIGGVTVLLQFVIAFGYFDADTWTPEQSAAVFALAAVLASAVQNLYGHLRGAPSPSPVVVTNAPADPVPTTESKPPRK